MDKQIITFSANEQTLRKTGGLDIYASKTVSYIEAHFDLGQNWSGYDSIEAVWWNDYVRPVRTVLDTEGVCIVPPEVLTKKGEVYVNLVGVISSGNTLTDRLTTHPITALTNKFNAQLGEGTTAPLTPSEYEQFVATVKADADRAEDAKDSARGYAESASASASSASASASNASTSETNAHTSEVNAKASELNAETYKDQAQTYAQNADISATNAENAKDEAIDARDEILGMSATATTLPAGSDATASYSDGVLTLGIPKGVKGDRGQQGIQGETGATPNFTIGTVETLEPTEDATATITGTAENPILNLGIPQGEVGEVSYADLKSLLPMDTASGAIVSITDGQSVIPVESLKVALEPIQDLHGYDKPWSGGTGKNKLPTTATTQTINGITFTVNDDGTIKVNGTATADAQITVGRVNVSGGSYTFSSGVNTGSINTYYARYVARDSNGTAISIAGSLFIDVYDIETTKTLPNNVAFVDGYVGVKSGITVNNLVFKPMIRLSSETDATWQPYSNICPISGRTEVVTERTGVNVWDEEWEVGDYSTTTGEKHSASNVIRCKNKIRVLPSTGYYFNAPYDVSSSGAYVYWYDANENYISYVRTYNKNITTPSNCHYMAFDLASVYGTTYNHDISINYPSTDTDYHAYEGTTHTTELEGNYTVVGTDNVPYLFKPVGEVDGDRLREKIVGGTVAWNQYIKSDFSSGVDGWQGESGSYLSFSASDGVLTATYQGGATMPYQMGVRPSPAVVPFVKDHKVLITVDINVSKSGGYVLRNSDAFGSSNVTILTNNDAADTWHRKTKIVNVLNNSNHYAYFLITSPASNYSNGDTFKFKNHMIIDLTQMFGSTIADYIYSLEQANAGAGVAFFKTLFPKPYYAYNAGELKSVSGLVSHDMTGFNAFDKDTIKTSAGAYILNDNGVKVSDGSSSYFLENTKVLPSTIYYMEGGETVNGLQRLYFFDAEENFISRIWAPQDGIFTTPSNCHYLGYQYKVANVDTSKWCLNISWDGSEDGNYEPYQKWSYPLDSDLELRGIPKLDNGNLYYDGDVYEADGTVTRRYGVVDLGSRNWTYEQGGSYTRFYNTSLQPLIAKPASDSVAGNVICAKFPTTSVSMIYGGSTDKVIAVGASGTISIRDTTAGTNPSDFKTAMSGVMLVYELATPTTETATPFEAVQKVISGGTLQYVTDSVVPVGHDTEYLSRVTYGSVDLVSGVLTVTMASVDLGTLNWNAVATGTSGVYRMRTQGINTVIKPTSSASEVANIVCSQYKASNNNATYDCENGTVNVSTNGAVIVYDANYNTSASATAFKTVMNGVQLVYELATPTTVQLTPTEVKLLLGDNNVWSDGDVAIVYSADVTKWIEKQLS